MKCTFLFILAFFSLLSLKAQFDENYQPLLFEGDIPAHFTQYLKGDLSDGEENLIEGTEELTSKQRGSFVTFSQYALSQAMRSGSIYLNPEINDYLNRLVDYLLRDQPDFREKIHVYGTKILIPNASCWTDGTLFVNLSLLPYLDNEAQLAYILSHEIAHYQLKHSLRAFEKEEELREQIGSDADKLFDYLRFSRENELEADMAGLDLYLNTSYPPMEALEALKQLKIINLKSTYRPLNLDTLFNLPSMPLDSAYNCRRKEEEQDAKNEDVNEDVNVSSLDFKTKGKKEKSKKESKEEEVERDDDELSTHPSIEARMEALKKVLPQNTDSASTQPFIFPEEQFKRLRTTSIFEYTHKVFQKGYYFSALYQALRMAEYFPENLFLQEIAGQSFYWITFYIERGELNEILPDSEKSPVSSYEQFICSMNKILYTELNKLAIAFLEDRVKRFPQSDVLLISLAKAYDVTDKEDLANGLFQSYLSKFSEGSHANYAKFKTQGSK